MSKKQSSTDVLEFTPVQPGTADPYGRVLAKATGLRAGYTADGSLVLVVQQAESFGLTDNSRPSPDGSLQADRFGKPKHPNATLANGAVTGPHNMRLSLFCYRLATPEEVQADTATQPKSAAPLPLPTAQPVRGKAIPQPTATCGTLADGTIKSIGGHMMVYVEAEGRFVPVE